MKRLTQNLTSYTDDCTDNLTKVHDYLYKNDFNFIDKLMVQVYEKKEDCILQEMSKATLKIGVYVDETRLKEWLKMCESLQNIPSECAEDIAIQSKIKRLEKKINALEDEIKSLISENKALKKELENG